MFEITINIPGLPELAAAIRGITPATGTNPVTSEAAPAPAKAPKAAPAKAEKATPAPEPAKPAAPVEEAPEPEPAKPAGPSAEDLLAAAKDKLRGLVAENEGNVDFKAKLRSTINEHGAKNISGLPTLEAVKAVETALEGYIASL